MTERYFVQADFVKLSVYEGPGLLVAGIEATAWNLEGVQPVVELAMGLSSNEQALAPPFSRHLRHTRRSKNGFDGPACATSIALPLVTARFSPILDDTVIWELQTERVAEEWLGALLTNQDFAEGNLGKIMRLC